MPKMIREFLPSDLEQLDTVEKNTAARRLYEGVGFVLDQRLEEARLWLR